MAHKPNRKKLQFLKRDAVSDELRQSFHPKVDTTPIDKVVEPEVFKDAPVYPEEPLVMAQNYNQPLIENDVVVGVSFKTQPEDAVQQTEETLMTPVDQNNQYPED